MAKSGRVRELWFQVRISYIVSVGVNHPYKRIKCMITWASNPITIFEIDVMFVVQLLLCKERWKQFQIAGVVYLIGSHRSTFRYCVFETKSQLQGCFIQLKASVDICCLDVLFVLKIIALCHIAVHVDTAVGVYRTGFKPCFHVNSFVYG